MKRRLLLSFLLLSLLAAPAWGACPGTICYIRSDAANDAGTAADWTNARKSLAGAISLATDGDVIIFAAGNYTGSNNYGRNVGAASVVYRAATSASDSGVAGWNASYAGNPVFDMAGAAEHLWYFTTASKTISVTGITFKNANFNASKNAFRVTQAITLTVNACTFIDNGRHLEVSAGATISYTRSTFKGGAGDADSSYIANSANGLTLTYTKCKFLPSTKYHLPSFIFNVATPTVNIFNCLFAGVGDYFLRLTADGTVNFKNNVVMGISIMGSLQQGFNYTASGTRVINESNNLIIYNPRNFATDPYLAKNKDASSFTSDPTPILSGLGYVGLMVDDGENLARAESIAAIFNAAGYYITFAPTQYWITQQDNYAARLQALVNAGNDIIGHGYSNTDLTKAGPVDIDGAAAGSKVKVIGTPATGIELDDNGDGAAEYTFTIGVDGTTVGELITWVNSGARVAAGWAAREIGGSNISIDDYSLLSGLNAATTSTATGAWTNIPWLIDATAATGHYLNEIKAPKTWLQNIIQTDALGGSRAATYPINYFSYCQGLANKNVRDAVSANYTAARGFAVAQDTFGLWMEKFLGKTEGNIFRIGAIDHTYVDTEDEVIFANHMAIHALQGTIQFIVVHTIGQLTDAKATNMLNKWKEYVSRGLIITTFNSLMDAITNAGSVWEYKEADATNGGAMWGLKAGSEISASFNITGFRYGSPVLNAGTVVAGIHDQPGCVDFAGRPCNVGIAPDIGAYESRKVPIKIGSQWVPRHQP